jgi:hypothetical protein
MELGAQVKKKDEDEPQYEPEREQLGYWTQLWRRRGLKGGAGGVGTRDPDPDT